MKKPVSILALGILSLGMVATVACGGEQKKEAAPAEAPKVVEEKPAVPATPATAAPATPDTAAPATTSTTTSTTTTTTAPEKK